MHYSSTQLVLHKYFLIPRIQYVTLANGAARTNSCVLMRSTQLWMATLADVMVLLNALMAQTKVIRLVVSFFLHFWYTLLIFLVLNINVDHQRWSDYYLIPVRNFEIIFNCLYCHYVYTKYIVTVIVRICTQNILN